MEDGLVRFNRPGGESPYWFEMYNLETDWKTSLLAERASPKYLQAKSYLTQLAVGNNQIMKMNEIALSQRETNSELRSINESAILSHRMIEEKLKSNRDAIDEGFSELMQQNSNYAEENIAALSEISNLLDDGFDYLKEAIECATQIISTELAAISSQIEVTNSVLLKIENVLRNSADVKVKELINRIVSLVREAMKTEGDWKYANFNDALIIIEEARQSSIGHTNPIVWLHRGYILWKCTDRIVDEKKKTQTLVDAKDSFDRAARLFTRSNENHFAIAMRNKANMQYMFGDFEGSIESFKMIPAHLMSINMKYELARALSMKGMKSEAIKILRECFVERPFFSVSIFGDNGFNGMIKDVISLINTLVSDYKNLIYKKSNYLTKSLSPDKPNSFAGSFEQHNTMAHCSYIVQKKMSLPIIIQNANKYLEIESKLMPIDESYEYAAVCAVWGLYEMSSKQLVRLIDLDRANLSKSLKDKRFTKVIPLIKDRVILETNKIKKEISVAENVFVNTLKSYSNNAVLFNVVATPSDYCKEYISLYEKAKTADFVYCFDNLSKFGSAIRDIFAEEIAFLNDEKQPEKKIFKYNIPSGKLLNEFLFQIEFLNIMLLSETIPSLVDDSIHHLFSLYKSINQATVSINLENRLGVYVLLKYKGRKGFYDDVIFVPNKEVKGIFGKRYVKYKIGEKIPFNLAVPVVCEFLTNKYMEDLVLKLKDSKLFS